MTIDDPWQQLPTPDPTSQLAGRRIDADMQWEAFWAKDHDARPVLYLAFAAESCPALSLPKLKGIQVDLQMSQDRGVLLLRLLDPKSRDLFLVLCRDIIARMAIAASEPEAVALTLRRTWRWHHLLRGAGNGLLSPEAQKGLIGELRVLIDTVLPRLGARDAVLAWRGPLDAPKDFELGENAIEAKARRGAAAPFVNISSEFQLDTVGVGSLLLAVVEVARTTQDDDQGQTLPDMVSEARRALGDSGAGPIEEFDALLVAAGFDDDDEYGEFRWLIGETRLYKVDGQFPRLADSKLPPGVSHVKYSVDITALDEYAVGPPELEAFFAGVVSNEQ